MTGLRCAWCTRPLGYVDPETHRRYCDARCSQAARDYRRGRGGHPGQRPRQQLTHA